MRIYTQLVLALILGLLAQSAWAWKAGDIILRAGPITVDPNGVSSDNLRLNDTRLPGTGVYAISSDTQLGITGVYMITDYFGAELLVATPFNHTIKATGGILNDLGIRRVGDTDQLPPTLSAVFYPLAYNNPGSKFQPFVGLGINYTMFYNGEASGRLEDGLAKVTGVDEQYKLELDNSWGFAARAGFDYAITDKLLINAGIWYMDIETEATFKGKVTGTEVKAKNVEVDPWVYTISLGYRF